MPEGVLTVEVTDNRKAQKKRRWFASSSRVSVASQEDEDQCLRDVIKAHACEFFKGHGGKDEDWGEEEMSVREEMLRRWRQSEWGKLQGVKEIGARNRWVGTSFDIGVFLGVNILYKVHTPPLLRPGNCLLLWRLSSLHQPSSLRIHQHDGTVLLQDLCRTHRIRLLILRLPSHLTSSLGPPQKNLYKTPLVSWIAYRLRI